MSRQAGESGQASKIVGLSMPEDDFEFIETPAAPSPAPESQNFGVRTTSVRRNYSLTTLLIDANQHVQW